MNQNEWDVLINLAQNAPQGKFVDDTWERIEMEKAIQLKRAGRYQESIEIYERVINRIPQCDPAYKQMAKVQIVANKYEDAIRSTLMKLDLGIFFTKQSNPMAYEQMRLIAMRNIQSARFSSRICFGGRIVETGEVYDMCINDRVSSDVGLLAYAEEDIYYYLGHCLVRLFPSAFAAYKIPEELLRNFENAIAGRNTGPDARDSIYALVFYGVGFLLARENISWTLNSITPEELRQRYHRVLNFLGLSESAFPEQNKKKSFWAKLFG